MLRFHISGVNQPPERAWPVSKSDVAYSPDKLSPELALLSLTEGEPAPSAESAIPMADQNISATPYPFYATGGDDDSVQHAVLTSHAGASVERNQDSQFAAARSVAVLQEVSYNRNATDEAKYQAVVSQKDSEIRSIERFAELKAELAVLRAEGNAREVASLRAELAESKAAARADSSAVLLAAIAKKIGL